MTSNKNFLTNEYMAELLILSYILKTAEDYCKAAGGKDISCINWNTSRIHDEIIAEYRDEVANYLTRCEMAEHLGSEKINPDLDISYMMELIKSVVKNEQML